MDNALFMHYGRLSERCFLGDLESVETISFFPDMVTGVQDDIDSERLTRHLPDHADPDLLAKVTKAADRLRRALLDESRLEDSRIAPPTTQKFNIFRKGLAQGSEAMLAENPFYELTVLIYQLNMSAIKNAFAASQKDAGANLPQAMKVSRSLRYLWGREGSMIRLEDKIMETAGTFLSIGKILLGLILFIGSTLTTAKGVNDLVQLDGFVAIFGDFLLGQEHENVRLALTLTVGVALSSVILDFKDRLFQGLAETGKVFMGFIDAFKRFPRWMFLSLFFTMASIWTNYDGIVLLFSKTQDLAYQLTVIEDRVGRALGDPESVDPDNPDSLSDLKGLLEQKIGTSSKQFQQVVDDEMSGVASSGIASKGPRYWSKYYIINGGYKPGTADVVRELRNSKFNRSLDRMLQRSGLDLSMSLEEKLKRILDDYSGHYAVMKSAVNEKMAALAATMTLQSYSIDELNALFNLEAYHVNNSVKEVVALMEANKQEFARAAAAINHLAETHIAVLRKVDKAGIPTKTEYTIDVKIEIPRVEAIDQLNQSEIPMAERRSVLELKELLLERYGTAVGATILFWILFIAVFMDLSDPIFYSTMVARWGRRDRHFLQENIKRFQAWEDEYVQRIRSFLARPDVRAALPELPCPRTPVLHWIYHQYLESLAPFIKDYSRLTSQEKYRFWFFGLFSTTRIRYAEVYNARQSMTRKILADPGVLLPPLLNRVYGNLFQSFSIGQDHFDTLFDRVKRDMSRDEERFNSEISRISAIIDELYTAEPELKTVSRNMKLHHKVLAILHATSGRFDLRSRHRGLYELLYNLFSKPIARSDFDFALTRNNWMVDQAVLEKKSISYIDSLIPHRPVLITILSEILPHMKKELLLPLMAALDEIPQSAELQRVMKIKTFHDTLIGLERELLCVLGMSSGKGLRIDNTLFMNIMENSSIEEVSAVFLTGESKIDVFEKKLVWLEKMLESALAAVKRLVAERKQTVSTLTRIRTDHLRPMSFIFEKFNNRDLIEEAVGMHTLSRELLALDNFIISMWGSVRTDGQMAAGSSADEMGSGADMILARFAVDGREEDFSILAMAGELEENMAAMKKSVESKVFLLTFLDKTIDKTRGLISNSFKAVANIFIQEARLVAEREGGGGAGREKLNFLEDHNLFLQSVPLFLESSRSQLLARSNISELIDSGQVDSLRLLESRIFKIHTFLKDATAYLNGEMLRSRLSAPLDLMEGSVLSPAE